MDGLRLPHGCPLPCMCSVRVACRLRGSWRASLHHGLQPQPAGAARGCLHLHLLRCGRQLTACRCLMLACSQPPACGPIWRVRADPSPCAAPPLCALAEPPEIVSGCLQGGRTAGERRRAGCAAGCALASCTLIQQACLLGTSHQPGHPSRPPQVEPTAIAALNLNWPGSKLTVHVLDDGRRPAMARLVRRLAFQCRFMQVGGARLGGAAVQGFGCTHADLARLHALAPGLGLRSAPPFGRGDATGARPAAAAPPSLRSATLTLCTWGGTR